MNAPRVADKQPPSQRALKASAVDEIRTTAVRGANRDRGSGLTTGPGG
jgi:hypothetical protein